ncbi:MAG: hypothetical protein NZ578_13605, partial [Candidatus Binatia bacterium]|nr:hypothetical protein [Candidatus Binatia bacterium]
MALAWSAMPSAWESCRQSAQTAFLFSVVLDERDFQHHRDYIHYEPVQHGSVQQRKTGRIRRFLAGSESIRTEQLL